MDFREYLTSEGLPFEAAALAGRVNVATISRICSGQQVPRPITVVKLARGLGVSPKRMQALVDASLAKRQQAPGSAPETAVKAGEAA